MITYTGITSLDGYINDVNGHFDWSEPDAEVHEFVNELTRPVGTYVFGRRMYETLAVWQNMPLDVYHPYINEYARLWRSADKVVYSKTLEKTTTDRTRLERSFDPTALGELRGEVSIGGPTLAAQALDVIDEFRMLVSPVIVGGGTPYLPKGANVQLELLDERRFGNGVVFLRYARR